MVPGDPKGWPEIRKVEHIFQFVFGSGLQMGLPRIGKAPNLWESLKFRHDPKGKTFKTNPKGLKRF